MITAIPLLTLLQFQMPQRNFQINCLENRLGVYDGSCIAKILNITDGGMRPFTSGTGQPLMIPCTVVTVTLFDSLTSATGNKKLIEMGSPDRSMFRNGVGQNYFVIATKPADGKLRQPTLPFLGSGYEDTAPSDRYYLIDQVHSDELYAELAWPTTKTRLATGSQSYERVVRSAADTLIGSSPMSRKQLMEFFDISGMMINFEQDYSRMQPRPESEPVVATISSVIPQMPRVERVQWIALLYRWKVPNSEARLWASLLDACNVNENVGIVPYMPKIISKATILSGCTTPEQIQERWNHVLDSALRAGSHDLFIDLMEYCPKPDIERIRQTYRKIVTIDQGMQESGYWKLARWHKDKVNVPVRQLVAGQDTWVNQEALKEYWRTFLGIT